MNIEQLNGNGQHVRVFIITAIVALAVTGGSWFAIEQVNSYRKWRKAGMKEQYDKKTQFSLAVRLALIGYLVSHWHTLWMFKSGAWWRIIVNHRSQLADPYVKDRESLTAGEYVSKYSRNPWTRVSSFFFPSEPFRRHPLEERSTRR